MDTSVTVLVLWALKSTCYLLSLGDTHPLVKGKTEADVVSGAYPRVTIQLKI